MNFYNLANSVHHTAVPVSINCAQEFELMSGPETASPNCHETSESCTQTCEEMPASPSTENGCETSESCTQTCVETPAAPTASPNCSGTSESCTQTCAEMAASPMTGYICDVETSATCSEGCGLASTSKNKNFAAPPQFQSTSTAYQAAPAFLC